MQIIISGVDRTNRFRSGSLEIEDTINERSMARLQLVDVSMTMDLQDGQQIQIYDDFASLIFAGFLLYPKKHVPLAKNAWYYDIECVDNHQIADRWLVAKTYVNTAVHTIVNDLYTTYLVPDGITLGNIATTSVTLDKASFPRVGTVSDALNELCDITGFNWYIDYDKKFYFTPRSFFTAPFGITSTSSINNVQVRQDRSQYRNRQYIRGGQIQTDEIALEKPTPNPDGVSRVFITRFPISDKPRIFINSVEITATDIGINGVDKNKKYYYDVGKNAIVQDGTQTVLSTTDVIQVTYKGLISLAVVSEDVVAIANRASLEGNTGVYERIDVDTSIVSRGEAISIATGKLEKYTKVARQITYDTYTAGLAAGQLQTITLPEYNISSTDFLIDKVTISELDGAGRLVYTVHAIDGDPLGGWQKFYNDLLKQDLKASIRENELLVILTATSETEGWTETTTQTTLACFVPSEFLYPSDTLIPCGLPTGTLSISPTSWSPPAATASTTISVTSNVAWSVFSNQPWLTFSPVSGSNNGSVVATVAQNTSTSRSGAITVIGGGVTQTASVTQAGVASVYAGVIAGDIYKQTNGLGNFIALSQTSRSWKGMTSLGTNVYACVDGGTGNIYMQTGGLGNFVSLAQTAREWTGMATANGNVYCAVNGGDIYMQTGGVGNFIALAQTARGWVAMAGRLSDVYACVYGGDIYKQTGGTGNFVALGQTSRAWYGMTALGGDVYACVNGGDIYKQTGGTGNFVALGQTSRSWSAMASANGNVYACVQGGDIYIQTGGTGNFAALGQTTRLWRCMTSL
jgi:hypothetical protein